MCGVNLRGGEDGVAGRGSSERVADEPAEAGASGKSGKRECCRANEALKGLRTATRGYDRDELMGEEV